MSKFNSPQLTDTFMDKQQYRDCNTDGTDKSTELWWLPFY